LRKLVKQNGLSFVETDGHFNKKIGKVTSEMLEKSIDDVPDNMINLTVPFRFLICVQRGKAYGLPSVLVFVQKKPNTPYFYMSGIN
jgi:hypothetical protein